MRILMVCLGNICRSPLAEGILKHHVEKAGLNWTVESAGTSDFHIGEPPHVLSQKIANLNGIDISKQQCRQFDKDDIERYDKIYVMDAMNYSDVMKMSGAEFNPSKVDLILNEIYPNEERAVPDPWYGTEEDYHTVYKLLNDACKKIVLRYSMLEVQDTTIHYN
jgi:protein-tyrosine phosphatase